VSLVRRLLRHSFLHLNDPAQSLLSVHRLVRREPVLVEQFQDVVNDRIFSCSEQVRCRKGSVMDSRTGILVRNSVMIS